MTIAQMLDQIIAAEGGYVDDENDAGGATNFGITQATLTAWRSPATVTKDDVKNALVAAQGRLAVKLKDAQKGMVAAMKILADESGVDTLRKLPDDQAVFRKIIAAAEKAGV